MIFDRLKSEYKPVQNLVAKIDSLKKNGTRKAIQKMARLVKKLKELEANTTLVHIYFKELGIIRYLKDELYGILDVIGRHTVQYIAIVVMTAQKLTFLNEVLKFVFSLHNCTHTIFTLHF